MGYMTKEEKKELDKECLKGLAGAGLAMGTLGFALWLICFVAPRESYKTEQGFANPNKLEIKVEDLNENGEKETLMVYDGKSYSLKLDEQGRPVIQAYGIKNFK